MNADSLAVLMVGRIFEEDEVFKLIEKAIAIIIEVAPDATFYFTDARTHKKVANKHPKVQGKEFVPSQHHALVHYIITIGGDGTILYAAKEFKTYCPPIVTFHRGSLGFMCRFELQEMEITLKKIVEYHFKRIEFPFEQTNLMRLEVVKTNVV